MASPYTGPGAREVLVVAGPHAIVAKKSGHLTQSRSVQAPGGHRVAARMTLPALSEVSKRERRWAVWKPWAMAGGGALVTILAIPLGRASVSARDQYESEQLQRCPTGCSDSELADLAHYKDRSRLYNRLEVGAYALGSAALVAGGVLVYLNREHEVDFNEEGHRLVAVPTIGRGQVGLAMEVGF